MDLPQVSEILYVGLCREIGTPTEVTMRRDILDMEEMINKPVQMHRGYISMKSGSHREGFRFNTSDQDSMSWSMNNNVICKLSQVFDAPKVNFILMENSTTPGFVKLKLLTPPRSLEMKSSLIRNENNSSCYISSEKFRNTYHNFLIGLNYPTDKLRSHGPCSNFYLEDIEIDYGRCMACKYWPLTSSFWTDRCKQKGWPVNSVLKEMESHGCHIMPVGSKRESTENEQEWRLSFSQAEQKMIYSLNHTQFLCYGVLKIFLKEVLCSENQESLICSYFLKTILFWEIQNNPDDLFWCPSNLLSCFWVCLKCLYRCVLDSNCPNFFIPENNMFKHKVVGASREALLSQLHDYYEMKERCLLLSPTLSSILEPALGNPSCVIPFSVGHEISMVDMDLSVYNELLNTFHIHTGIEKCFLSLKSILNLSQLSMSQFQSIELQYAATNSFAQTAFILIDQSASSTNKTWYRLDRKIVNMLKLSSMIGPVSQLLFLAAYYYRTGRFKDVLTVTGVCQKRFSEPFVMFDDYVDMERYGECIERFPLGARMKKAWMNFIYFSVPVDYITELHLEHKLCQENSRFLYIPPFVLLHMLCVLSNFKLGDVSESFYHLRELKSQLELFDDGTKIPFKVRDLSWQILGICQHVVGDLKGALQSYKQSLEQRPYHVIQRATETRIKLVIQHIKK